VCSAEASSHRGSGSQHPLVYVVAEEQRYQRQNPTLAEEEQLEARDEGLGTLLDQLGGSIKGTQVDILPKQVTGAACQGCGMKAPPQQCSRLC
jgi:hypothetical protein